MKQLCLLLTILFSAAIVYAQTKKIQPFTGAMTIENGIRYDDLEIKIKDNLLLTPDIPQNEELVIRITKPWSFIADAKGNVHPGIGFRVADKTGKILTSTENIYKNDKEGINQNYLSALSFTITLDDKMKVNDSLTIYTKFFDTKNGDSLLVILPCKVVPIGKAQTLDGWNSFSSTFGATGMYVNCKAESFEMKKTYAKLETATNVDTILLSVKTLGDFVLKNNKAFLKADYILYDKDFHVIETRPLFANAAEGLSVTELTNIKQSFILPAGFHNGIARIMITDKNGKGKLDAIFNFVYL